MWRICERDINPNGMTNFSLRLPMGLKMNNEETLTPMGRLQLARNNIKHSNSKIVALLDSYSTET